VRGRTRNTNNNPKAALVWRTGLSGAPPDSVRCTREPNSKLATFGNSVSRSAIIHRTVRCSTGLSGVPSGAMVVRANGRLHATVKRYSARLRAQKLEQAHQTVNSDCPTHHRTVRWPSCQKLQRSEPNGRVTWLAHRTVRCAMRQKPSPTVTLVVGAINTPNHPPFIASKFSAIKPHTRALDFIPRHKQKDQILSRVQRSFQSNSD
jgi:hypothetical protein